MKKVRIERNQIWKHKVSGKLAQVRQKQGDYWIIVGEGNFQGSASHKVRPQTLWSKFILQGKDVDVV